MFRGQSGINAGLAHELTVWQKQRHEHARAGAARVGGNAARAAGASAGARVINYEVKRMNTKNRAAEFAAETPKVFASRQPPLQLRRQLFVGGTQGRANYLEF